MGKTGKHGHAKAVVTAVDIFTGKKYEDSWPTAQNIEAPIVDRKEYELVSISEDKTYSLRRQDFKNKEELLVIRVLKESEEEEEVISTYRLGNLLGKRKT